MAEIKDIEQEERNKEVEEKKVKDSPSWISFIPPSYWLYASLVWVLVFLVMRANGYNPRNIIFVVLGTIGLFYFMAEGISKQSSSTLNQKEAFDCLVSDVQQKQKDGVIERRYTVDYYPDSKLIHDDASPSHYNWGVALRDGADINWYRVTIYAKGDTKGYVLWPPLMEKWTGRDTDDKDKMYILTALQKQLKSEPGFSIKDMLTGRR